MMNRCKGYYPAYSDCTISEEWCQFSNFKKWMENQDWKDKELDKDLLVLGNRVYASDLCCFLPGEWNHVFERRTIGIWPIGVRYDKRNGWFYGQINICGKTKHIGTRRTALEAHQLWQKAMVDRILRFADTQEEPIKSALLFRAARIQSNIDNNIETDRI